ncbi:MAG: class I SAM-dependent methyltransferase [Gemmataceae bacterium]
MRKAPGRGKIAKVLARRGGGRLLDFGCGGGRFLKRMHCAGWDVTGLDASEDAVKRIRFGLGLRAHVGTLPFPSLPDSSFDLITMWQTLEHVHDPLEALRDAYRLLAPGGELIISLPNIDSLPFRIFGHAWLGLDLPRHLTHFTPPTLHAMLERAGFSANPAHMIRRSGWLRASAKLANRLLPGATWQRWLRAKPPSSLLTWYSYVTAQSDCMMVKAFK